LYSKLIRKSGILKKFSTHYQRTFEHFLILIFLLSIISCDPPNRQHTITEVADISPDEIKTVKSIPASHKEFIARFLPNIQRSNNKVLVQRNLLLELQDSIDDGVQLSDEQLKDLNGLLKKYKLDPVLTALNTKAEDMKRTITGLLERVDIIPVKLVMAQAIVESGWGESGFAKNQNNYFGIHCYTEGCGVKPAGNENADFYVKSYPSEMVGIEDYIKILNTGNAYRGLRETRTDLRRRDEPLDPIAIAHGLLRYSAEGDEYIAKVSKIINDYIPKNVNELLSGDGR
jgi:Bax protein